VFLRDIRRKKGSDLLYMETPKDIFLPIYHREIPEDKYTRRLSNEVCLRNTQVAASGACLIPALCGSVFRGRYL